MWVYIKEEGENLQDSAMNTPIQPKKEAGDGLSSDRVPAHTADAADAPAPSPAPDTAPPPAAAAGHGLPGAVHPPRPTAGRGQGGDSRRSVPYPPLWLWQQRERRRSQERLATVECLREQLKQSGSTRRAWVQHDCQIALSFIHAIAQMKEASRKDPQPTDNTGNRRQ